MFKWTFLHNDRYCYLQILTFSPESLYVNNTSVNFRILMIKSVTLITKAVLRSECRNIWPQIYSSAQTKPTTRLNKRSENLILVNTSFSFVRSKRRTTDKYIQLDTDEKFIESVSFMCRNKLWLLTLHSLFHTRNAKVFAKVAVHIAEN